MSEKLSQIDTSWLNSTENIVIPIMDGKGTEYELSLMLPQQEVGHALKYIRLHKITSEGMRLLEIQIPIYTYDYGNPQSVVNLVHFIQEAIGVGFEPSILRNFLFHYRQLERNELMTYEEMVGIFW
jgi:hypothetical protein